MASDTEMEKEENDVRLLKPAKEVWADAKKLLKKTLKESTYNAWIPNAQLLDIANGEAVIGVVNDFTRTMILNNKETIIDALSQATNEHITLKISVDPAVVPESYSATIANITVIPAKQNPSEARPNFPSSGNPGNRSQLNPKYTFDTFVVGSHNRFCHSAAMAVAQKPAQAYNPLFLYGGVGLGKTHIMQAIGHEVFSNCPNANLRYMSCERFTNDLINSIRDDKMTDFRKRYRQVDVLLMDDIQFIQGKESTQEEFFHTFDTLRNNGKQIVISSDRPPKELALLEERLRSRFEWGLIADIQAPDLETRLAILRKKCELDGINMQNDVLEHIASSFTTNIRELEGALIRVHAYSSLTGSPLTLQSIKGILQPVQPAQNKPTLTIEKIIDAVAHHYRVESSEIKSSKRSKELVLPRHIAMYLAHKMMQMSYPRIGEAFSNRKHTSALYAGSRIAESMAQNADLAESIKRIERQLVD
jgi:chromosomal replication initiator protein